MQRTTTIALIIALIGAALIVYLFWLAGDRGTGALRDEAGRIGTTTSTSNTQEATASGTIVEIDTAQAIVDGPYLITIESANETRTTIAIPSMGILLCAAEGNIADVGSLRLGMNVEVRGSVNEDGAVVPCTSDDHYLRVAND